MSKNDAGTPPDSFREWSRTDRRLNLASLQAEAEDLGLAERARAFRRLALMAEVAECLASDSSGTADEVAAFCEEALRRLEDGAEAPETTAWIVRESGNRWGEYLGLIDPELGSTPDVVEAASNPDDAPSMIDPSALFRMLTGTAASPSDRPAPRSAIQPAFDESVAAPASPPPPIVGRSGPAESPAPSTQPARRAALLFEIPSVPSILPIDPELRDTFLAEATDLFDRIETLVLSLNRGVRQSDALHEIGRCFHTLKGAAGSVGLGSMAAVLHATEEQLEVSKEEASDELIDILHKLLHYLEEVFITLRRGGAATAPQVTPPPELVPTILAAIPPLLPPGPAPVEIPTSTLRSRPAPVPPPGRILETPSTPPPPPPPQEGAEGPVRVTAERLDELMDLASELISRRGLWSAQAEAMKEFGNLANTCRNRLGSTLDKIHDLQLADLYASRGRNPVSDSQQNELLRRVAEQAEDLVVLLETAQTAAKPIAENNDVLARLTLQLWESLQAIRIMPVKGLFQRLARVAHDAARVEGRHVEVAMIGEETGVDRALQDKAFEPLLHVVRNAVCHGIEPTAERVQAGKPSVGKVTLDAVRSGNTLTLSVRDDGRGLDYKAIAAKGRRLGLIGAEETPATDRLNALIFQPGFSTRDSANAIAGRGVGMDVVSQEVGRLHGTVALSSQPKQGTCLSLCLPARLALQQAMVLRLDGQAFALPVELIELAQPFEAESIDQKGPYPRTLVRDRWVPVLSARQALGMPPSDALSCPKLLLIRADGEPLAVVIDSIDGTSELVFKPLGSLLSDHPLISGKSLSVTGEVILSLNPSGLARWLREGSVRTGPERTVVYIPKKASVLVADDSISVRKVVVRQLRAMGHEVEEVSDGLEALGKLRSGTYGLVISDLEMPRMDGFELLAEIHRLDLARSTPVLVASTRSDPETRRRVLELGATDFLPKPIEAEELAAKIRALLYQAERPAPSTHPGPAPPNAAVRAVANTTVAS